MTCQKLNVSLFIWLAISGWLPITHAAPSSVLTVSDGVYVIQDDDEQWGGLELGITHQLDHQYRSKKILDLSEVPEEIWASTKDVRLSAYFCIRDYSKQKGNEENGFDEAFQIIVNGKIHTYSTNSGVPTFAENKSMGLNWFDFPLSKDELVHGKNEIVFQKAEAKKTDDYLYLGIDNSADHGNSFVSFDGGSHWVNHRLSGSGGKGEYMVRLYLITQDKNITFTWRPAVSLSLEDPYHLVSYLSIPHITPSAKAIILQDKASEAHLEWDSKKLDPNQTILVAIETADKTEFNFSWLDPKGVPLDPVTASGQHFKIQLPASRVFQPSGLVVVAKNSPLELHSISLTASLNYRPVPSVINMTPPIAKPTGSAPKRSAVCQLKNNILILANKGLRCRFTIQEELQFSSLFNELSHTEMVREPDKMDLFLVEIGNRRYSGSHDFKCRSVRRIGKRSFRAELELPEFMLEAILTGNVDDESIYLGLTLTNRGKESVDFKVAFPHLAGLALSHNPSDDYYFFPWGGGIIADRPAIIRRGYGDHAALYQIMDLFSPSLGAGLSVRTDDVDGHYKVLALRKTLPNQKEENADEATTPTKPEYMWTNSLSSVTGTSFTYEYLRRTREPGTSFSPQPAVLTAHPGDWHVAMKDYATWAHRVWKFRPFPSRLDSVITIMAPGWAQKPLFKDGHYRTDFLVPRCDCVELMSWWEWSPLGPWRTPWDKLEAKLGKESYERYKPYWVHDPITGKLMYSVNRGDYDGYNARWGGLPAFQKAIQEYQQTGTLVTLYTDPILACDNTKTGQRWGELYGVIGKDGKYVHNYYSWNMCHDVPEYRQFVADTMKRVMQETGVDGIRLDEYGHKGWACFNPKHHHTFEEPGCTEWQRAISETTKLVHTAMDEVNPKSILMTEHPGYDYLLQFIEGCITYDLTVQSTSLRPLECNIQRFYFPECKAYELDHREVDKNFHKRFWNMVSVFAEVIYPQNMYAILKENNEILRGADCEPLVPTLTNFVYANRFGSGSKTLWTIYNASGHTIDGDVLLIPIDANQHLFDLLKGIPCTIKQVGNSAQVNLDLPRDDVACIARLPCLIKVTRSENEELTITSKVVGKKNRFVICNSNSEELLTISADAKTVRIPLKNLKEKQACCVKLIQDRYLLDVIAIP